MTIKRTNNQKHKEHRLNQLQTLKCNQILNTDCNIHSCLQNFPHLLLTPNQIIQEINEKLEENDIKRIDTRINGSAATFILDDNKPLPSSTKSDPFESFTYNDIDILFHIDFEFDQKCPFCDFQRYFCKCGNPFLNVQFSKILKMVQEILRSEIWSSIPSSKISYIDLECISQAYIQKKFKEPKFNRLIRKTDDCWSLISLRNKTGRNVELKFVHSIQREYLFSIDSFQIVVPESFSKPKWNSKIEHMFSNVSSDSELTASSSSLRRNSVSYSSGDEIQLPESVIECVESECSMPESELPRIVALSVYKDGFDQARFHLLNRIVSIENPESIRGGGLLKYVYLKFQSYKAVVDGLIEKTTANEILTRETYMITRFCIDYSKVIQRWYTIANYVNTHFSNLRDRRKYLSLLSGIAKRADASPSKDFYNMIQEMVEIQVLQCEQHCGGNPIAAIAAAEYFRTANSSNNDFYNEMQWRFCSYAS